MNKPPDQYVKPEKMLEKPGKLDLSQIDASKVPLAGKLGTLGQMILQDKKNARRLTDYDWDVDCFMTEQVPKTILGKKSPGPIADKLNHMNMTGVSFTQANFSLLHSGAQYPATTMNNTRNSSMNTTQQFPFNKSALNKTPIAQTSYGARTSQKMLDVDHKSIRDDMSQSPRSIKATDKRIDYLVKAKKARNEKNHQRMSVGGITTNDQTAWAASGNIRISPSPRQINSVERGSGTKRSHQGSARKSLGDSASRAGHHDGIRSFVVATKS